MMQQEISSIDVIKCEREIQWGIAPQLLLSHMFVAGITIGLFVWLSIAGLAITLALAITLLLGSVLGLLMTWNIQYALGILCETLHQLSQGMPIALGEKAWWYWPFRDAFAALTVLNQRIKQDVAQIQLSRQYRTQLLQQASHEVDLERRHRLACDLHEKITQLLFTLRLSAATVQEHRIHNSNLDETVTAALEELQRTVAGVQIEMQALWQQLHATLPDHTSLGEALQTLVDTLGDHTDAALQIKLGELPGADRLPRSMQELIFGIAQDACDNIARYAYPQHVWLELEQYEQTLRLKIRDDGQGFDPTQVRQGIGLAHMHERTAALKGTLSIQSQSGQGTTICVIIPLLQTLPEQRDQRDQEWNVTHKIASVRTGIQIGEWAALTTLICIALYTSVGNLPEERLSFILLLLFSLGSTIYGYLRAHTTLSHVALAASDHMDEIQELHLRLRSWHLWKYRLALAGSWFLVSLLHAWHNEQLMLEFAAASCGLLVLLLRAHGAALYAKRQRYTQLSHARIRWELHRWQQALAHQGKAWFLGIGCYILLAASINGTAHPPGRALQLFNHAPVIVMLLWGLQLLLEALISHREMESLLNGKDQAPPRSKEMDDES